MRAKPRPLLSYISSLRAKGTSAVFITHNIYHAYDVADRFVVMCHGRKVSDIPQAETSVDESTQHVINS